MKIVREHINEKFIKDSDPIHDMGIGMRQLYLQLKPGDTFRLNQDLPGLSAKIFRKGTIIRLTNIFKRQAKSDDDMNVNVNYEFINKKGKVTNKAEDYQFWYWSYNFFRQTFEPIHIKESLDEKFVKNSDPIHDMDIGPEGYVYRCIRCGALTDETGEELTDEELTKAQQILDIFGEKRIKSAQWLCFSCDMEEQIYNSEMEAQAREQERQQAENEERWYREHNEY